MRGNSLFLENFQIAEAFPPAHLGTADISGDWIDLREVQAAVLLIIKGAGSTSQEGNFDLQQASDNAGTDAATLEFPRDRAHLKSAADISGVARFSAIPASAYPTTGTSSGHYNDATAATHRAILVWEIRPDDLDDGMTHVRVNSTDSGSTTTNNIAAAVWILETRDQREVAAMPSAIE